MLYRSTQFYGKYPRGHPEIITSGFKDIDKYYGIVKCKVLPPRALYHPVLPRKCGGRLKFPLCALCADKELKARCTCTNEQRAMIGTWCTDEVIKAVELGYEVLKIYEIYHWDKTIEYNPQIGEKGLFTDYISTFLKIKQEASGFPAHADTIEKKMEYITQYHKDHGIMLDFDRIEYNPGLRSLAKLCLNRSVLISNF